MMCFRESAKNPNMRLLESIYKKGKKKEKEKETRKSTLTSQIMQLHLSNIVFSLFFSSSFNEMGLKCLLLRGFC